ncbi:hypothetical protein Vadar_012778 [Vaccinium darrowii]|uniref:Uncharacterized protein n=1 Tax=Vaccinium darrowii TaxID=229202 RepID=A0ACB7YD98_9ERIC|nr:hypothetical protein Vadar_012778 [Vaccinium darrowii]
MLLNWVCSFSGDVAVGCTAVDVAVGCTAVDFHFLSNADVSLVSKPWLRLYSELLETVIRRLPPGCIFSPSNADVSLVSKRWLRLYRSSRSVLYLRLSPDNCIPSSFLSHFPHLYILNIIIHPSENASDFADQILLSVASSCPKLTTLCLRGQPVSLSSLLSLSTSCPSLAVLVIGLSRPVSFHWLLSFHSLRNLTVCLSPPLSPSEFKPLDDEAKYSDAELQIEVLLLRGIKRGDYGFDWLWRSCKNLKKLDLWRCQGIGADTSVSSFANCIKGLQEVQLRSCASVVNDILSRLVENCTSLKSLLIQISKNSRGGGSREGLLQFFTHSRCNLRKLDLYLCLDLENNHLLVMADKFRGLSSLRLNSCLNITGEGLKTMVLAMSNELEELALINYNMEPGLLTALGQRFQNLKKLDLSFSGGMLGDEEFISMLESCNCLWDLKVRGCTGLTYASVISMFKSCKQLVSVDIVQCPGIEPEAVELFVLNCMRLRQIHVEDSKLSDVSRSWASKKFVRLFFD